MTASNPHALAGAPSLKGSEDGILSTASGTRCFNGEKTIAHIIGKELLERTKALKTVASEHVRDEVESILRDAVQARLQKHRSRSSSTR